MEIINFPIYDQGQIGPCTANALAAAVEYDRLRSGQEPVFIPSRLFLYYNERKLEGSVASDAGAYIRDGVKSLNQLGICPETEWPYVPTPAESEGGSFPTGSAPATQPPQQAYNEAANHRISSYQALQQILSQLQGCFSLWVSIRLRIHGLPKLVQHRVHGHSSSVLVRLGRRRARCTCGGI